MQRIRFATVGLLAAGLLPLAAVEPVLADTSSPAPLSVIVPDPLSRFSLEIDGATAGGANSAVNSAFLAWYAAHPDQVIAFLQFLQDNPAVAADFFAWATAHPDGLAALYQFLALPAVQKVR